MKRLRHPIRAIREPFGTAGLIVAICALVLATTGAAFAAKGALTSKQKKEVEKIAKKFAGAPGAPGAPGAKGDTGAAGGKGDTGSAGAVGAPGAAGAQGKQGIQGIPGLPGEAGVCSETKPECFLPSGATETGTFAITSYDIPEFTEMALPISFSIPLKAPGEVVFLNKAETQNSATDPNGCTGTVENPTAPEGVLCLYTADEALTNYFPPEIRFNGTEGEYEPTGTVLRFVHGENTAEPNLLQMNGSWAVTAP